MTNGCRINDEGLLHAIQWFADNDGWIMDGWNWDLIVVPVRGELNGRDK
jgi:hypothetical protein